MSYEKEIQQYITAHPVVLFMKGTPKFPQCGFSARAVSILYAANCHNFYSVNVLGDADLKEALKHFSNWPTFPQLYIKGLFVGGADIMMEMFEEKELQALLKTI